MAFIADGPPRNGVLYVVPLALSRVSKKVGVQWSSRCHHQNRLNTVHCNPAVPPTRTQLNALLRVCLHSLIWRPGHESMPSLIQFWKPRRSGTVPMLRHRAGHSGNVLYIFNQRLRLTTSSRGLPCNEVRG